MEKFCSKCGQKLPEFSRFCTSCGAQVQITEQAMPQQSSDSQQIPLQQSQMNGVQAPNQMYYQQPQKNNQYFGYQQNHNIPPNLSSKNSLALAFSIIALVLSVLGSIIFGIFLSIPSLILAIVSVVMSADVKKRTNGVIGQGALVIGIIAIVLAALFTIGYLVFAPTGYGPYGWIGGSYKAYHDYSIDLDDLWRGLD